MRKAVTAICLDLLWDNASNISAKFKMCFCKVILWLHAEGCGRRQHLCCPTGCPLLLITCGRAVPSICGETWTWERYGPGGATHWKWHRSTLGLLCSLPWRGRPEPCPVIAVISLQRESRSGPHMKEALSRRYDLDTSLTGKHRISTLSFTMFLTDFIRRSSPQHTGFYITRTKWPSRKLSCPSQFEDFPLGDRCPLGNHLTLQNKMKGPGQNKDLCLFLHV